MPKIPKTTTKEKKDIAAPAPKDKVKPQGKIESRKRNSKRDTTRRLSEVEKATIVAMRDAGASVTEIAHRAGCSTSTAYEHMTHREKTDPALVDIIKKEMAGKLFTLADRHIDNALRADKIEASSAYQSVGMTGIALTNALNIERGAPPSQVNQIQVNVQLTQLQDEIAAMISKATTVTP